MKCATNTGRMHLRLPPDTTAWLKAYASKRKTTASEVIRQLLMELYMKEMQSTVVDAEQI